MQHLRHDNLWEVFSPSVRYLGLLILVLIASACGGGGGGGDDDDDIGISYAGNRNPAVITQGNAGALTSNVISTSGLGYTLGGNVFGARNDSSAAASKLSLTETALKAQAFARHSLQIAGVTPAARGVEIAARNEIDETEACDSGTSRITGEIDDDLTGEVEIDFRQCRYGQTTMNGRMNWTLHAVDQNHLVPTHSTFTIVALTITTPRASATIGGAITNRFDFASNSEQIGLSSFIARDNATGSMTMASSLQIFLQYDHIGLPNYVDHHFQSGRIYDSTHGYVDVVSLQPLRYDDIYGSFPNGGVLQLSAVGRLTVSAAPSTLVHLSLDTDQPPDGVPEFSIVVPWDSLDNPSLPGDDDLDDDNISDGWEIDNGLDPLDPDDASLDFDFDGFDNLAEFLGGTDPNDPDSMPPLSSLWQPGPGSTPDSGNFVYLESDSGDYIGAAQTDLYTDGNSVLSVVSSGGGLTVSVSTAGSWTGNFRLPIALGQLEPGYHGQLQRFPFHDPVEGGLSWSGMGRVCNTLTGWFIVDNVVYENNALSSVDLRFGQHCESNIPALRGQIHWVDTPPDPPPPPPAGLWQPAPGVTPDSDNYIYLESQGGDFVGQGGVYLYTDADSVLSFLAPTGQLNVSVNGDESWSGSFQSPNSLARMEVGFFDNLQRYPFHNPVTGGLSWTGEGRGCNTLSGWFVVDSVTYDGANLSSIELRFEQHCEGGVPALNGKLVWDVNNSASPPGPIDPPPAGLWQPAAGITPASGNYVYLESQVGDYIGAGGVYLYTPADAILSFATTGGRLDVAVNGDESWTGDFQAMNTLTRLEPGYYGDLQRYPFHNPARGGLSWTGEGRGCNTLSGWFVVDSVTYDGANLSSIELRFEQHCEGGVPALNGKLVWDVNNSASPPGPIDPPPAGLWQPAAGITPASGNYVYLESQAGDYIGAGGVYLYTPADAILSFSDTGGRLNVSVNGAESWNGTFQAMYTLVRLGPGYYGNLQRYPFHNTVRGGLSWSGEGRGCNQLSGWFVVDSVTYTGIDLTAIELRFEQHCEGGAPALNGKLRWSQ